MYSYDVLLNANIINLSLKLEIKIKRACIINMLKLSFKREKEIERYDK